MMRLPPLLLKQHLTEEIQRKMTKLYLDVSALELKDYSLMQEYTITHPYGKDKIVTDEEGEINYTEDIGAGGPFSAALKSRIGTFLKWDPAVGPAPAGYVGNPDVEHKIVGGYNRPKLLPNRGTRNRNWWKLFC